MRNRNTMFRFVYILETIFWAALSLLAYRVILFYPVFGWSAGWSTLFMICVVAAALTVGVAMTIRKRRNFGSIFTNVVWAWSIYYGIALWPVNRGRLLWILGLCLGIAAVYALAVLVSYLVSRRFGGDLPPWKKVVLPTLMAARTLTAWVLCAVLVVSGVNVLRGVPLVEPEKQLVAKPTDRPRTTVEDNEQVLRQLSRFTWMELDATQRLSVLQVVADIEADALGIPGMAVCAETLEENTLGVYRSKERIIAVDLNRLLAEDSLTMVEVICHECYHGYQEALLELYRAAPEEYKSLQIFDSVAWYEYEFSNYIYGNDDYGAYYHQLCETDSRRYAASAIKKYSDLI